jgi:head-tail adaptor
MAGPLGKRGMHAGRLRNRVRVEAVTGTTRNEYGAEVPTWGTAAERVFCEVQADAGREFFASGTVQADVSHRVVMRDEGPTRAITPKRRLVWLDGGNAVLNVVAVKRSVGGRNLIEVQCLAEA